MFIPSMRGTSGRALEGWGGRNKQCRCVTQAVFRVPNRNFKGRMVDALARKSDEGRGVAAIRFGEVPSNL